MCRIGDLPSSGIQTLKNFFNLSVAAVDNCFEYPFTFTVIHHRATVPTLVFTAGLLR
ncbi:MAG: hypothetical protein ACD_39C01528G0001, partial [uncultured bacterium]